MTDALHAIVELDGAPFGPLAFGPPRRAIEARTLAEVQPALRAVDAAARAGSWAVGYVAYEAAPAFDAALTVREPGPGPLCWFGLHDAPLGPPPTGAWDARLVELAPELEAAAHAGSVERLREAIAEGTAYQVNLTLRFHGRLEGDPLALYRRLRAAQGGGQTVYLRAGDRAVVSASPELFLHRRGDRVVDPPHEGDGPARPVARGGRGGGAGAGRVAQGAGRERDDRRPAPQRPWAGRRARLGACRRALRAGAVPDRLAAHLHRRGAGLDRR